MDNMTIGGIDERTGEPFASYETIAGGMGARPDRDGVSGVHTHMTNSLNTPAEALEYAYPLRVTAYSLRKGSGGAGKFRGGGGGFPPRGNLGGPPRNAPPRPPPPRPFRVRSRAPRAARRALRAPPPRQPG